MMYLVVKCTELDDQYECDANRTPLKVVDDYSEYNTYGYEIYKINTDGSLDLIRNYDEVSEKYISVCFWHDDDEFDEPYKVIDICKGDRYKVTTSMIKKIKYEYGFTEKVKEIAISIDCSGQHGEKIGDDWVGFGERMDNVFYPRGY